MKKKPDEPKKGAPAYMNTYGDMMTLLLTFFVLLFSMSTIDAEKYQQLVSSMSHASISIFDGGTSMKVDTNILQNGMSQFPVSENIITIQENAAAAKELDMMAQEIEQYTKEQSIDDKVTVEQQGDHVTIRFGDVSLFDPGKAELKAGSIPTLNTVGNKLKSYLDQGYQMKIMGHTDNRPIKNSQFPSNWELSNARAIAVMRFYLEQMDFNVAQMECSGRADVQPIATNDTLEGRAKNRRVEIILTKGAS